MKLFFAILLMLPGSFCSAQWTQLTVPTSANIVSSSFISDDEGWIGIANSGAYALAYHTADGGDSWVTDTIDGATGSSSYLNFVSSTTGYAVVNGVALKTIDGGDTWNTMVLPGTPFYEPYFIDDDTGFITGESAMYKTTDGGQTWEEFFLQSYINPFFSMDFLNSTVGAGCEYDYYLYGTDDGGQTWNYLDDGGLWSYFFAVSYKPDGDVYYTGYEDLFGDVTYFIYGPNVYSSQSLADLYAINWFDNYRCYAAGAGGYVVSTINGGNTWDKFKLPSSLGLTNKTLNAVDGFNDVYIFGDNGYAFKLPYTCEVSAVFDAAVNYLDVAFTDQSFSAQSWFWDFGDGTTSTDQNPVHVYADPGDYEVCLIAGSSDCGADTLCNFITVCAPNTSPQTAGSLDLTFDDDGISELEVAGNATSPDIAIQGDGKILLAAYNSVVTRYNVNGTIDSTFGVKGVASTQISTFYQSLRIEVSPQQKILVAGVYNSSTAGVVQLDANGTYDSTFSDDGWVDIDLSASGKQNSILDLLLLPDGKILVAGYYSGGTGIAKLNADGSIDLTFGNNGVANFVIPGSITYTGRMALKADGKMVIGLSSDGSDEEFEVVQLNADGTFDTSFGTDGIVKTNLSSAGDNRDFVTDVVVQPDGKIIAAGFAKANGSGDQDATFALTRYNADGSLDNTFDGNGMVIFQVNNLTGKGSSVAIEPDGKILVAGTIYNNNLPNRIALTRLNADGSMDPLFGNNGTVITSVNCEATTAGSLALDNDKIYLNASRTTYAPNYTNLQCVLRYQDSNCVLPVSGFSYTTDQVTVSFTDISGNADSWLWDFGDGTTSTDQHPVHTYAQDGSYVVCLVASDSCGSDSSCETIDIISTGVSSAGNSFSLNVFPNPMTEAATIQFSLIENDMVKIDLRDLTGRKIKTIAEGNFKAGDHLFTLHREEIVPGIYFLETNTGAVRSTIKIVIL